MLRSEVFEGNADWEARCGKTARRVLSGGSSTRLYRGLTPTSDNVEHGKLIEWLKIRIRDDCFIRYVVRFLKSGYRELQ